MINRDNLFDKMIKKNETSSKLNKNLESAISKIKISGKQALGMAKVVNRFKRGVLGRRKEFSDIGAYKKLYEAYEYASSQNE